MTEQPSDIFGRIQGAAVAQGLPFLLIGGHAVHAHGYTRTTLDVDLVVRADDSAAWEEMVAAWGYGCIHKSPAFAQYEPRTPNELPLDLVLVDEGTFEKLKTRQVTRQVGSAMLPIASVIHLIALKLHATRNSQRLAEGKDLNDIVNLVRINHIDTDGAEFREVLDRYASDTAKERLLEEMRRRG